MGALAVILQKLNLLHTLLLESIWIFNSDEKAQAFGGIDIILITSTVYFSLKLSRVEPYSLCQRGSTSATFLNQYIVRATISYGTTRSRKLQEAL